MVVLEKTLESPYHYELLFNILGFSLYGIMQHVFFGILFLLFDVRYLRSFDFFLVLVFCFAVSSLCKYTAIYQLSCL